MAKTFTPIESAQSDFMETLSEMEVFESYDILYENEREIQKELNKLCDVARIEGARLALEAAAKVCDARQEEWDRHDNSCDLAADDIRALAPADIIKGGQG